MMLVNQCMKKVVKTIPVSATVGDAVNLFCAHHVGMLPVVNEKGHLVGILQLRDLLHLIMPAFVDLIEDIDYVGDFGAMEDREPAEEDLSQSISVVMEEATCVKENSGLLRAFAFIHKHQLSDLPVVNDEGKLVGLASRVDIGRSLLVTWWQCMQEKKPQ
jgi:CBS-domain-containing membrane protein